MLRRSRPGDPSCENPLSALGVVQGSTVVHVGTTEHVGRFDVAVMAEVPSRLPNSRTSDLAIDWITDGPLRTAGIHQCKA